MNPAEIAGRIENIKSTLEKAFDEGKIDFDHIGRELDAIKNDLIGVKPERNEPATLVSPEDYR
jgi:hypothetical protein